MISHAPANYDCPFCKIAQGEEDDYTQKQDIVFEDQTTLAFVAPRWWVNNSPTLVGKQPWQCISCPQAPLRKYI